MGSRSQRRTLRRGQLGCIIIAAAASTSTLAQTGQPADSGTIPPPATQDAPAGDTIQSMSTPKWTISIEPLMWYVGPSGKIKLPASSGTGPGSFTDSGSEVRLRELGLEGTRLSPAGNVQINADRLRFTFWGTQYSTKRDGFPSEGSFRVGSVPIAAGDPLDTKLTFSTFQVTGGYRIYDRDFKAESAKPDDALDAQLSIHAIGGVRLYDIASEVTLVGATPQSAKANESFIEPMAGVRAELDLAQDFTISIDLNAGGFPGSGKSSFSLDVALAFIWRPTPNVGLQIGWRQLAFALQDGKDQGEFKYDGRLAGLFAGIVIRF